MRAISGQLEGKGSVSGDIRLNGVSMTPTEISRVAGYVSQEDVLMGTLTPREALRYAAQLELVGKSSIREQHIKVENIIEELALTACADTVTGYIGVDAANSGIRGGLSGGERKRLAIGMELLSEPSLIFLVRNTLLLSLSFIECAHTVFFSCLIIRMSLLQLSAFFWTDVVHFLCSHVLYPAIRALQFHLPSLKTPTVCFSNP